MTRRGGWGPPLILFVLPGVVLVGAYGWLAAAHGRLALWSVLIHENGRLTLRETVFYFSHFLREVPVDLALALFLAAAFAHEQGASAGGRRDRRTTTQACTVAGLGVLLIGTAFAVVAARSGTGSALTDLLQYRTRDSVTAFGSHWHYHWLSTLWIGQAAPLAARVALGRSHDEPRVMKTGPLTVIAWSYFLGLTVIWGLTPEVFTSVRYAGHQAREIATLAVVTTPLTLGVLCWMTGRHHPALRDLVPAPATWARALPLLLIPLWLAGVMISGDVMSEGQSGNGLAAMVAGHVFEHVLDYALVALTAAAAWLFARTRPR